MYTKPRTIAQGQRGIGLYYCKNRICCLLYPHGCGTEWTAKLGRRMPPIRRFVAQFRTHRSGCGVRRKPSVVSRLRLARGRASNVVTQSCQRTFVTPSAKPTFACVR